MPGERVMAVVSQFEHYSAYVSIRKNRRHAAAFIRVSRCNRVITLTNYSLKCDNEGPMSRACRSNAAASFHSHLSQAKRLLWAVC